MCLLFHFLCGVGRERFFVRVIEKSFCEVYV